MLELSMVVLFLDLFLSVIAATVALVSCACMDGWDKHTLRRIKVCLCLGFVAVTIYLLVAIYFNLNVYEYSNLVVPCLISAIINFCSYNVFSMIMLKRRHDGYIRSLLDRSKELTTQTHTVE